MEYVLRGRLNVTTTGNYRSIVFGIGKTDAPIMLCYLTALELGRPVSFVIKDQQAIGKFTYESELQFKFTIGDANLQGAFTKEQTELIKSCITDNILWGYYDHIDFSHELCDFTFRIS